MKISKLFHWLYASVMFIPLVVIPVFAIYSRNENATFAQEVTMDVNKVVDFNQQLDITSYRNPNITYENINGIYNLNIDNTLDSTLLFRNNSTGSLIYGHKYYYPIDNSLGSNKIRIWTNNNFIGDFEVGKEIITYTRSTETMIGIKEIYIVGSTTINQNFNLYINLFDLTQMFGAGNEPSAQEFRNYFPYDYYPYTASEDVVIENYETIIYNDTDVGSQYVYTLYNVVDKYFNLSKMPIFDNLYIWFSNYLFSGTGPMWFFIAYNLLVYWLFVSLFWLIFDVLMYVPSMVHKMLDKARME